MGDIAIDHVKFSREECSFFPSSATPQDPSGSGVGELICSCYADGGGVSDCCFDFGICAGLSIVIAVITAATRDNHRDLSNSNADVKLPLFFLVDSQLAVEVVTVVVTFGSNVMFIILTLCSQ